MATKARTPQRREESLTRDAIIDAAVSLLDARGEAGLTFRALSESLNTGPGAIYWHVANKSDLVTAACDAVIARTAELPAAKTSPADNIRALARALFHIIDQHPWVGSALTLAPGELPMLRILERLGQQVQALGVAKKKQRTAVWTLLSYILGVAGHNAANGQHARAQNLDRAHFLNAVADAWTALDPRDFPFTRTLAAQTRTHDDLEDFLAGINLILKGIAA